MAEGGGGACRAVAEGGGGRDRSEPGQRQDVPAGERVAVGREHQAPHRAAAIFASRASISAAGSHRPRTMTPDRFSMLVDVLQRVGVDENQVRPLAGGDDPERVLRLEVLADVSRPGLDDLVGRHAGIGHALHLAVEREAGHVELLRRIAAEQQPDAAAVQRLQDADTVVDVQLGLRCVELRVLQARLERFGPLVDLCGRQVLQFGQAGARLEASPLPAAFPTPPSSARSTPRPCGCEGRDPAGPASSTTFARPSRCSM